MRSAIHTDANDFAAAQTADLPLFRDPPTCPIPNGATPEQRRLMRVLDHHRGRARAIPIHRLCTALDSGGGPPTERQLKAWVQDLRVRLGVQIGACRRSGSAGLFLCRDAQDAKVAITAYRKQMISMAALVRVFLSRSERRELLGQLRLQLEPEDQAAAGDAARAPEEAT